MASPGSTLNSSVYSREEIRAAVRSAIAGGAKDIGKVMSQVLPKYKGRADGKLINQIVREEFQAG